MLIGKDRLVVVAYTSIDTQQKEYQLVFSSFSKKGTQLLFLHLLAMALPTSYSLVSSVALSVLTFAAMQVFKDQLSTEGGMTILGGFVGSWIFVFLVTIAGNLGTLMFGETYHIRTFPEVLVCLVVAMGVSASVHRVCATSCIIFSLISLYYMNKISQATHTSAVVPKPQRTPGRSSSKSSGKSKNK